MHRLCGLALCLSLVAGAAKAGGSFEFDGVDDAVEISALDLTAYDVITVTAWLYEESFGESGALAWESSASYTLNDGAVILAPEDDSGNCTGRATAGVREGNATGDRRSECSFRPSASYWHHWAIVYDNSDADGDVKIFIDGVEQSTVIDNNAKDSGGDFGVYDWHLMNRNSTSLENAGGMGDFRIYGRELTAAEISFVVAGKALGGEIVWLPMRDSSTPLVDMSGNGNDGTCSSCPAVSQDSMPSRELLLFDPFDDDIAGWSLEYDCTTSAPPLYDHVTTVAGRYGVSRQASNCFSGTSPYNADQREGHFSYWDAAGAADWSDYEFTVWIYNSDDDGVGLAWRYDDIDNHYRVDCDDSKNFCALVKVDAGTQTIISGTETVSQCNNTYFDDGWHEWRVTASGDDFEVSIDGVDCFGTVTDSAHDDGTVAFWGWGSSSTYFDSARVRELP